MKRRERASLLAHYTISFDVSAHYIIWLWSTIVENRKVFAIPLSDQSFSFYWTIMVWQMNVAWHSHPSGRFGDPSNYKGETDMRIPATSTSESSRRQGRTRDGLHSRQTSLRAVHGCQRVLRRFYYKKKTKTKDWSVIELKHDWLANVWYHRRGVDCVFGSFWQVVFSKNSPWLKKCTQNNVKHIPSLFSDTIVLHTIFMKNSLFLGSIQQISHR